MDSVIHGLEPFECRVLRSFGSMSCPEGNFIGETLWVGVARVPQDHCAVLMLIIDAGAGRRVAPLFSISKSLLLMEPSNDRGSGGHGQVGDGISFGIEQLSKAVPDQRFDVKGTKKAGGGEGRVPGHQAGATHEEWCLDSAASAMTSIFVKQGP
jgi:hypothetical protein